MYDIITIGEILVEILTDHVGQKLSEPGKLLGPYPSGAPAIAIDQAGRMGARAAIIAKVGDDGFGKLNLDRLSADGVDISHVITTKDNSTGTAFVTYFENGDRQFIFHFTHAACGDLSPADIDEDSIRSSRYLHIMGCSITGSPTMGEAIIRAVRLAKENGVKISFDPNIRPELLNGQIMLISFVPAAAAAAVPALTTVSFESFDAASVELPLAPIVHPVSVRAEKTAARARDRNFFITCPPSIFCVVFQYVFFLLQILIQNDGQNNEYAKNKSLELRWNLNGIHAALDDGNDNGTHSRRPYITASAGH